MTNTKMCSTLNVRQHLANWRHFAARHDGGGHVLRGDGSVQYYLNDTITTDSTGIKDGGADYNRPEIVWDPLGPARLRSNRRGWAKGDRL